MVASQNGHVEVVDKLLQHGATVDLLMEVRTCVVSGNSTSMSASTYTSSQTG